jgi:hypothetical protein
MRLRNNMLLGAHVCFLLLLHLLQGLTGMDDVEKAVRMGADAESMVAREMKEPRCVAGEILGE